jgi:acyl-CoA synthetase (AMP-forming)/AMP-acid ligase II
MATLPVAPDLLRARAGAYPDRLAISLADGTGLTFGEWNRRSDAAAHRLRGLGVRRGSRVALIFGDDEWVPYAIVYLGVLKAGGTAVHLGTALAPAELRRRLAQTTPDGIIRTKPGRRPAGFTGWMRAAATMGRGSGTPEETEIRPDDIADILYTSGTTGPAKAFTNPHGTLTFRRGPAGLARLDGSAPMLAPMPMGTASSAMCVGMMPLNAPSTVVLCRPDDVDTIGSLIEKHGVATVLITPWIALRMANARLHERHDLSSVTTLAVASARLPAAVARTLRKMIPGVTITSAYAQGEAVPAVVLATYDPDRPAAIGRPAPGTDLRVADPDGNPVPDGELGEIWLRSAAPKRNYLEPEERTDGWTRTRDLGYIGADGDLYLFDRAVDAIPTATGLLSSLELEDAAYTVDGVREAAVVGSPSGVRAYIVTEKPEAAGDVRAALAHFGVTPTVRAVAALPRGVTGKVLKHKLKESR